MVLGTSSGAGKSLMTAALCRVLRRRGETPLTGGGGQRTRLQEQEVALMCYLLISR